MSTRERWIVYPLLIFSLMMGIKTRYFQDTFVLKAEKIECSDLTVTSINGRPARLMAIIPSITSQAKIPQVSQSGQGSPSEIDQRPSVENASEPSPNGDQPAGNPASAEKEEEAEEPGEPSDPDDSNGEGS